MTERFDASKHLTKLQGKDYLEVKWRLVWLRTEHPDADIETEMLKCEPELAVFKAIIRIPGGGGADGHGSETPKDFRDFIEKAETKAIGRALAALGFGTQFCDDHNFEAGNLNAVQAKVVDSPVQRPIPQPQTPPAQFAPRPPATPVPNGNPNGMTDAQRGMVFRQTKRIGMTDEQLHETVVADYKKAVHELTKAETSQLIDWLLKQPGVEAAG
jgi:hypothetical protein